MRGFLKISGRKIRESSRNVLGNSWELQQVSSDVNLFEIFAGQVRQLVTDPRTV